MDAFQYFRVKRPALQQFAQLAINSNDQHPAHQRDASRPSSAASFPVTPSQLHATLSSILSPTSASAESSSASFTLSFPSPLIELIVEYALCTSFLAADDAALHEHWQQDGISQVQHSTLMHTSTMTAVTSLLDGQHCATASHDGRIIVARQISRTEQDGSTPRWQEVRRIEHKHAVHALQGATAVNTLHSTDSNDAHSTSPPPLMSALVVGSSTGLFLYDPPTGRMLHELTGHSNRVSALCVLGGSSSSASVVVSASWDGCCRVWSLQSLQCECVLRERLRPLTCVAAVDRGCVVAGDATGQVLVWQFAAAMRASPSASAAPSQQPLTAVSSSIASVHFAGHTSPAYVFRSPDTPVVHPIAVPVVLPSSQFSASSAATRSVLSVPSCGLVWVGSDDGLRLFAPSVSESGEWLCLRSMTPNLPVHNLQWLSSCRMVVGMSKKLEVWNCQSLLEKVDVKSAEQVHCEWTEMNALLSVRGLAVRHSLDITQPVNTDTH